MTSKRMIKQIKNYVEKTSLDCQVVKIEELLKESDPVAQVVIGDYNLSFWVFADDAWETVKQKMDNLFKGRERAKENPECPLCLSCEDCSNKVVCAGCNNGVCSRCHMKMIIKANPTLNCPFCRKTLMTIRDDTDRLRHLESYMAYYMEANWL